MCDMDGKPSTERHPCYLSVHENSFVILRDERLGYAPCIHPLPVRQDIPSPLPSNASWDRPSHPSSNFLVAKFMFELSLQKSTFCYFKFYDLVQLDKC